MAGPPGSIASLGSATESTGAAPVNIAQLERTGERLTLLQRHAPELVSSSVSGALALAESNMTTDAMLNSASDAVGYSNVQRLYNELTVESTESARALWANTPEPLQKALKAMGYAPPEPEKQGGKRWGINLPDFFPIDELTIARDTPVLGPLGNIQAGLGEGLEGLAQAGSVALKPFEIAGQQGAHIYRSWKYIQEEKPGGANLPDYFAASDFSKAWRNTENDDGYVRPEYRERARRAVGGSEDMYRLAHYTAMKLSPSDILEKEGLEPGTPEANQLLVDLQTSAGDERFRRAVHELSVGQVSVGRVFAQEMGFDDTDAGWGRYVSGALDAGFAITSDPTLFLGGAVKAARFGRGIFLLEDVNDVQRGYRMADLGLVALKSREGKQLPSLVTSLGNIKPWEMRRGRGVLSWADRVSDGFRTGQFSQLMRDIPAISTGLSAMSDYHLTAAKRGLQDLSTSEGVLRWLRGEEGLLALAGSRLGGASPLIPGLKIPTLTARDRTIMRTKGLWNQAIDWSRLQVDPFHADRFSGYFRNVAKELGNPRGFGRQMGRWTLAHTAGPAGRVVSALTAHTPYDTVLPLFGDAAVPEFTRLVNTGVFSGFTRQMMDDYIDAFVKNPGIAARSGQVEQLLDELFTLGGVKDDSFYRRFVGRYRQAYAIDGGDVLHVNGIETRAARLVDAQHADALAIPNMKQFFAESQRANWLRAMFHNPGASWVDTRLGRAWKPSVLMRIGFIPRAAGEELFHFVLKHGPRTYLGAKGAEWTVNEELAHHLRAQLNEAKDLGQLDLANRIEQRLADATGAMPPLRALMSGADRMFARLFESSNEASMPWRRRLALKAEAFDPNEGRGVVTGLERWANHWSIFASDAFDKVTKHPFVPSKAKMGEWMAYHWNPKAALAARDMIEHPWVARSFAEQISGATLSPYEFRNATVLDGQPVAKVRIAEIRGGIPVVEEVPLRPMPGEFKQIDRHATQDEGFFQSMYARHNWVRHDRVGNAVLGNVLPRWVGGTAFPKLSKRLGYGDDVAGVRADLNTVWAHVGEVDGREMLWHLRRYLDGVEPDAGKGWLGGQLKRLFEETGVNLKAGKLLDLLDDPKFSASAKRWLAYDNVDPTRLINDFPTLVRKMKNTAAVRLSRTDMQRHLTESRLYTGGGHTLAVPVTKGLHKAYVPLMPADYEPIGLGEDFVDLATKRIVRIGGYSPETAEAIARRVAATSRGTANPDMATVPLAAWGSSDPRVADAVMAAAEQVTGVKPTFGILTVPEDVIQRSAGQFPQGLHTDADAWQMADDWTIEPWRMSQVEATEKVRRFVQLQIDGEWWDDAALDAATHVWRNQPAGTTRWYSENGTDWTTDEPPDHAFWFFDGDANPPAPEDMPHKLPGFPPDEGWDVGARQVSPGLGESEALEQVAHATVDEMTETLTTAARAEVDDDVLHEVVEPLLRPDRVMTDAMGNKVVEPGYTWEHLVAGTGVDRLPTVTYGPDQAAVRGLRWSRFVQEFFSGPVNRAISSVVRKPLFLTVYGEQLEQARAIAPLFVSKEVAVAASAASSRLGLPDEALDDFVLNAQHMRDDVELEDLIRDMVGADDLTIDADDLGALKTFAAQRNHGLELARTNALNRTFNLITPFIDDHRIRSAFQGYVGNFVPFLFAEEQFLKRWARSVYESPEMVRKAQLMMNGLRSMGTVRKDAQGNEHFVYPAIGEATQVLANAAPNVFGVDMRLPYPIEMTGDVGYTLPGFGDQTGVPSVGPLVAMGVEFLSRHYPEIADIEDDALGRGANRSLWQYIVPSSLGNLWQAAWGDMDKGQLASLNLQAIQNMAVAGQLPPEDATPAEREHFLEQVRGQVRFLAMVRSVFGMNMPASPQIQFPSEALSEEFQSYIQADLPMEEAVVGFLEAHPDIDPADLLSVTVSRTESEFSGLDKPTDRAFAWMKDHEDLINAYPAGASWIIPRAEDDDPFSFRAWNQQLALGLRKRKMPDEFLNDIYFTAAARDYFDARTNQEARLLTATGETRRQYTVEWDAWKKAYFLQHPVFEDMLSDTTRQQRRRDALDQLTLLSADEQGPVPEDMREMIQRYDAYRQTVSLLKGDRRGAVVDERRRLTEELKAWMLWHVTRYPSLAPLYLRTIEPELGENDEDAATPGQLT